jgi:hypothetical protein
LSRISATVPDAVHANLEDLARENELAGCRVAARTPVRELAARSAAPVELLARADDPFAEIDQLAARRRQREGLPST